MKISRSWLQTYFDRELPSPADLAEALTFHAFEIESIENDILDVKVTPNRGHDALSHRGIAKELSAILQMPLKKDPLRSVVQLEPKTSTVSVQITESALCRRFTAAHIRGVRVGPSPEWLRVALESVSQRSINSIVDITNYVMLDIGQPLHAFDASKLSEKNGLRSLRIRKAKPGEKLVGLDDKEYELDTSVLTIEDENSGSVVSIAGIKGGKSSGIDEHTTEIILEAANWDGVMIRKTSQALRLRTDASERFQQVISPECAAYGTKNAVDLVLQIAGGEVIGFVDEYPVADEKREVSVSVEKINATLGTTLSGVDVANVFKRLDLPHAEVGTTFTVTVPFERLDLTIPEDLIEEVGRIVGYDTVPAVELPPFPGKVEIDQNFAAAENMREELVTKGYSEVYTSVFVDKGERVVLNKVDGVRPYLRDSLLPSLQDALEKNVRNKDLLGIKEVKLFEIGTVWRGGKEIVVVATLGEKEKGTETPLVPMSVDSYDELPYSSATRYQSFSRYPFIVRDIALWVPSDINADDVLSTIRSCATTLLVRSELFDRFEKNGKVSLAFRLVFQSFEKTLTDQEVGAIMENVVKEVAKRGWEVR